MTHDVEHDELSSVSPEYRYRWWAVPNVQEDDESYASFTLVEKFLSHFPLMRGANSSLKTKGVQLND